MRSKEPTLAILTHPIDRFWRRQYFVQLLIPRWEAMGIRVVVVSDPDDFVPADLALLHVDLSVVPDSIVRLAERYPRVLNGAVLDIRQRRFSRLLLERGEPHAGPVIVKTNWNCRGTHDFRFALRTSAAGRWISRFDPRGAVSGLLARLEPRRSWRRKRVLPKSGYPVYETSASVPSGAWRNPNLVVERFVAEREGAYYACRHWVFFGDREVNRRTLSLHPVVKFRGSKLEPTSDAVPEELRALRTRLGFDYGKFDYGIVDGEVAVYDVNRTPSSARNQTRHTEAIAILSEGIRALLA